MTFTIELEEEEEARLGIAKSENRALLQPQKHRALLQSQENRAHYQRWMLFVQFRADAAPTQAVGLLALKRAVFIV